MPSRNFAGRSQRPAPDSSADNWYHANAIKKNKIANILVFLSGTDRNHFGAYHKAPNNSIAAPYEYPERNHKAKAGKQKAAKDDSDRGHQLLEFISIVKARIYYEPHKNYFQICAFLAKTNTLLILVIISIKNPCRPHHSTLYFHTAAYRNLWGSSQSRYIHRTTSTQHD